MLILSPLILFAGLHLNGISSVLIYDLLAGFL